MLTFTTAEMNMWIASVLWPLTRILGLIAASPLYGNTSFPRTAKVLLGVMLALAIAPAIPAAPAADPMSLAGLLILIQELLIGAAMGFSMRIVFAAVEMAGEVASMTMGLGFAATFDPQTRGRSTSVSQFLALIATMAFMAVNGHLVLLEVLAESFYSLPISATPVANGMSLQVVRWGATIFSVGLQLSLPIVAALLITTVALGILTRAAPQLNIFGIGFPVSLGVGLLLLSQTLPYLSMPLQNLFNRGIEQSRSVPRAAFERTPPTLPRVPAPLPPAQ
ncbi:flagellar biosynthetic protein FliR [Massilia sp. PAMC28688]|uniref:flagellar biosynthetic protein FliR n=1 Tax=Massilia sp. PAMC28688 TaxID=2861283 RepID=UPI001C6300A4|nr:flagellar biosynthetic protein FliR [Massilia sp. PAMC28688]QYF92021.1 flagellar biosynthetic protein FliR [Massilia sp. PAMC28688]